jgi:predicted acyl esterase
MMMQHHHAAYGVARIITSATLGPSQCRTLPNIIRTLRQCGPTLLSAAACFLQQDGSRPVSDGSLVAQLNAAGYSVVGLDARGLGRSQGLFGTCMDFQRVYVSDLQVGTLDCCVGYADH